MKEITQRLEENKLKLEETEKKAAMPANKLAVLTESAEKSLVEGEKYAVRVKKIQKLKNQNRELVEELEKVRKELEELETGEGLSELQEKVNEKARELSGAEETVKGRL
jgi:hypothetical protein